MNGQQDGQALRKPGWLKSRIPSGENYFALKRQLQERRLPTICQSAHCPNIDECWNHGHATFLAMGHICTRGCLFCSVAKGVPLPLDEAEPDKILAMARLMNLRYLVVTSVTRDDLPDRGSGHLSRILRTLRAGKPDMRIELLIPDLGGDLELLDEIIAAAPDVLGHNLETVRRLYPQIGRLDAHYDVSLSILRHAKARGMISKSGIMVGLGELSDDLLSLFADLRQAGVDLLTIGQYLQPQSAGTFVQRYYPPEEFARLREQALEYGLAEVLAGPFVRSSYQAESLYETVKNEIPRIQ